MGASGFISHHHLVRYYLKIRDLKVIEEELLKGSVDGTTTLVDPLLKNFWEKLKDEYAASTTEKDKKGVTRSLRKAKRFIHEYKRSLHKHNKHFTSSELLFLACFGEHETSTMVAKLFQEREILPPDGKFKLPFHKRTIDLPDFFHFLMDYCSDNIPAR